MKEGGSYTGVSALTQRKAWKQVTLWVSATQLVQDGSWEWKSSRWEAGSNLYMLASRDAVCKMHDSRQVHRLSLPP